LKDLGRLKQVLGSKNENRDTVGLLS
jgi:hypothetical protein